MLAAKLGVTTSPTGFTGFKLRDGTTVESHRPRDGPSLLVSPSQPKQPPTCPFAATWWLVGDNGILKVSRRRAIQGGSYRGFVSLTRTVLWLLSLGTSDMEYPQASARTTGGHLYAPDLFTPETPMAHQGMTDQVILLRTPGCLRTVFVSLARTNPK